MENHKEPRQPIELDFLRYNMVSPIKKPCLESTKDLLRVFNYCSIEKTRLSENFKDVTEGEELLDIYEYPTDSMEVAKNFIAKRRKRVKRDIDGYGMLIGLDRKLSGYFIWGKGLRVSSMLRDILRSRCRYILVWEINKDLIEHLTKILKLLRIKIYEMDKSKEQREKELNEMKKELLRFESYNDEDNKDIANGVFEGK